MRTVRSTKVATTPRPSWDLAAPLDAGAEVVVLPPPVRVAADVDVIGVSVMVISSVEASVGVSEVEDSMLVEVSIKSSDVVVISTSGASVDMEMGASVVSAPAMAAEIESQSSIDPEQTGIPSEAVQSGASVGQT